MCGHCMLSQNPCVRYAPAKLIFGMRSCLYAHADGNVPYEFVLQPGIISRLCSFLSYRGDHVMELLDETAWVITNIGKLEHL